MTHDETPDDDITAWWSTIEDVSTVDVDDQAWSAAVESAFDDSRDLDYRLYEQPDLPSVDDEAEPPLDVVDVDDDESDHDELDTDSVDLSGVDVFGDESADSWSGDDSVDHLDDMGS